LARGNDSGSWGFAGLEGFFLSGDAATPAAIYLFLSQLPLVTAVTLLTLLALPHHISPLTQIAAGLIVSAVTYPLAGHWVSGGGWLAQMGHTLSLGHGLVDFAGISTVFVIGGATALAASLVFDQRHTSSTSHEAVSMPMAYFPLLAGLGVLLVAVGWIALVLSNPLYAEIDAGLLRWPLIVLNGLAGLAGGLVLAQLYSWISSGHFAPLIGARGALAGLIAVSAGAPFTPTWAALATGAIAGLLLPLALYTIDRFLKFSNAAATVVTYGLSGFWGLLAVALFADGRWGQGWNGIAGLTGQGVSGLVVAPGLQADGGQLGAQVWGAVAVFILGFVLPWGVFKLVAGLFRSRSRLTKRVSWRADGTGTASDLAGESQSAPGSLDRVVNVDDGG
jgi:Amt family ammonium transporter